MLLAMLNKELSLKLRTMLSQSPRARLFFFVCFSTYGSLIKYIEVPEIHSRNPSAR